MTLVVEDEVKEISFLTPKSYWIPVEFDRLQLGSLRGEFAKLSSSELALALFNLYGCPVSVKISKTATAREK